MDPPAAAFENTNYNECDVFPLPDGQKYAVFYYNKEQNFSSGLKPMTDEEIIDKIRVGRNLEFQTDETTEKVDRNEMKVIYMDSAGSFVLSDMQNRLETHDILLFTDVRCIDFRFWKTIAGDDFCVVHQPCFKKSSNCRGYGGTTVLYRRNIRVINQGRIFTWKLLNMEDEKIFPGVEGVFIDVSNEGKVVRYCVMFHWKHRNSKDFDPRINVINFISNFMTKTISPDNSSLPDEVHIFGRFNFAANEEFLQMVHNKHENLSLIAVNSPDIFVLSTNQSLFQKVSNDPHEIFSFILRTK